MLDQNDLAAIRRVMKEELTRSESLLLDELERTRGILERQIQQIQSNLEELKQYYRITKLENDNTALFLKIVNELQKEIADLKQKIA